MEILMVAAELAPYVRASETADSVAALCRALTQIGHKVTVALPKFEGIEASGLSVARRLSQLRTLRGETITVYDGQLPSGVFVVLFESDTLVARDSVFETSETGTSELGDARRFVALCHAARAYAEQRAQQGSPFQVVHAHDWPAAAMALLPPPRLPCVFTLHDATRAGIVPLSELSGLGFDTDADTQERFELDGQAHFVKAALLGAEVASTISSSHAHELKDPEKLGSLANALASAEVEIQGVGGGVDYAVYNPASDTALPSRFDAEAPERRGNCRTAVLRELELELEPERPVVVFPSGLDEPQTVDGLTQALPALLKQDIVVLALGNGAACAKPLAGSKFKRATNYRWIEDASPSIVRRALAAADLAVYPSSRLHTGHGVRVAQRYGAVPVALAITGNRDAIVDCDAALSSGTGFLYETPEDLLGAVERALGATRLPQWGTLRRRVSRLDLGWERPARRYAQLYRMALTS
jgi:starch synthase